MSDRAKGVMEGISTELAGLLGVFFTTILVLDLRIIVAINASPLLQQNA